ncbi:MAG: hypothetical protein A4E52_01423 [Pelotomaculum sp. PtaB.Bin013]|nr:MAG: hypothetical protein A4E52_01423 [Pelotomaculum sp. PtaB.Bin013]
MQGEVHAANAHEKNHDVFYSRTVVSAYTGVFAGKAACAHRTEGVNEGVEQRHSGQDEKDYLRCCYQHVDFPKLSGGLKNAGQHLALGGAGHLSLI